MATSPSSLLSASSEGLRIALDARLPQDQWGGVQQLAQGLAVGLSGLDGEDEYLFLAYDDATEWLDPFLSGPSHRVTVPRTSGRTAARRLYDIVERRSPVLASTAGRLMAPLGRRATALPSSDGTAESLGVDLLHFLTPQAYLTDLTSIYQPLDLLHVHVPESMSKLRRDYRERAYRTFSERAAMVAIMTSWGRADLSRHFGLPLDHIAAIPLAPSVEPDMPARPASDLPMLPSRFLLYPAQTWPHKNHLGLLDALATLRTRGLDIDLVCSGRLTTHYPAIQRRIGVLGLERRVHFVGYVDAADLAELYRRARALVFPSWFEGWGLPVVEAFAFDLPVACANNTCLPEVAGGAAALFDPAKPETMVQAILEVWSDETARSALVERGRRRAAELSWSRTARIYRALYRNVAGRSLTDEDRELLAPPTLVEAPE